MMATPEMKQQMLTITSWKRRRWRDRLFSRPWRPWRTHDKIVYSAPVKMSDVRIVKEMEIKDYGVEKGRVRITADATFTAMLATKDKFKIEMP